MDISFIRGIVKGMYDGPRWKQRVEAMEDDQVLAIYIRFQRDGKKPHETKEPERQLRLF